MQDSEMRWIGSAKKDMQALPDDVRSTFGYALYIAQQGGKYKDAKPLKGFGGAGVLEIIEDDDGSTYRAVYTIKFKNAIYVLHIFKKKSKQGIATPKQEIDLIKARLRIAEEDYESCKRKIKEKT